MDAHRDEKALLSAPMKSSAFLELERPISLRLVTEDLVKIKNRDGRYSTQPGSAVAIFKKVLTLSRAHGQQS